MLGRVRAGSAAAKLIALLVGRPVLSADDACAVVDAPASSVYAAIERLQDAGVLRPLTDRKRNQVWGAGLVLDELDELGARIARAAR
jgi:pyruvate/2-oxoglutarate dehydrogenase complex dihydrolipoamide dehydrogenase (E3) component